MYKDWLNNEYSQWVKSLQESTVDNFGGHPMVRRMLSADSVTIYPNEKVADQISSMRLDIINEIGGLWDFVINRMVYYGQKVLKNNPSAICEIGGGVGQFYAVLRALGYKGTYYIFDLPEVQEFQRKYLDRVTELTGLDTTITKLDNFDSFDYCVSFYAIGEFDDELKHWYIENVVKKCPHGLITWNPHSGASKHVPFTCNIEPEYPLTNPDNKLLLW